MSKWFVANGLSLSVSHLQEDLFQVPYRDKKLKT
jgi:hypothetical protein